MKQQICLNGHQISYGVNPETVTNEFCSTCGKTVISECQECQSNIFGYLSEDLMYELAGGGIRVPKYCKHCSNPYPWTKKSLDAASELIALSDLNQQEKDDFNESIPDLISDTPKTKVAMVKFKKYSVKAGAVVASSLRELLVDVASEATIKALKI